MEITMRLLHCNVCRTVDEIPDYSGGDEVDPLVEKVVMEHNRRDPMGHGGKHLTSLPMRLAFVDDLEYAYGKDDVLKKLAEEGKAVGFDPWVGEAFNTFAEDALKCYSTHRRPDYGAGKPCIDYMSDSKRIGRPTEEGKAVLKQNEKLGAGDPHLCNWCPYHTTVQTEIRSRKGMYKDK
jgi:hypothetical protein